MSEKHPSVPRSTAPTCCPCGCESDGEGGVSRRGFLGGTAAALGGSALAGVAWSAVAEAARDAPPAPRRKPLVVQPILTYSIPTRRPETSWRNWGGIQTQKDAEGELARIEGELKKIRGQADFPVEIQPVAGIRGEGELDKIPGLAGADVVVLYAAGAWQGIFDKVLKAGKDVIFFVRHKSGPVYLWYEIVSPRYLRRHTDKLATEGIDFDDVVVDSGDEVLWRLRSLCGLKNARGSRILAVGGPGGWATPAAPKLAQDRWKLDIRTVPYKELGELITAARADKDATARAARRAEAYLALPKTKLETGKQFVVDSFLLDEIFRGLMTRNDCRAITINACMGTIMPLSKTTACLALSTLNDDGYLAFCESDFVVIPAGLLLGGIAGTPPFLLNPTFPHDGIMTMAHCTAPRKMDGKTLEPVRILTHFESDFGAAPKVEMPAGRKLTLIDPDFAAKRWLGTTGEVVGHPFLPICRSQIDVKFPVDSRTLAEKMSGFHWMIVYGSYLREAGYALRRVGIEWESLG